MSVDLYPQLNGYTSIALSTLLSILFVGGLYLFSSGDRDNKEVIKRRSQSVLLTSLISYAIVYFLIPDSPQKNEIFTQIVGFNDKSFIWGIVLPFLLTLILFFGPLVMFYLDYGIVDEFITLNDIDLRWLRNYVIGPIAEEVVYRSSICPLLYFGGFSSTKIILFSPLLFGLSHLHHIYPLRKRRSENIQILVGTLLQVAYTSLFGMYSALIFMRTGNIVSCIIVHSFCNMMGLPRFQDISDHVNSKVLSFSFILGLVGFVYFLPPLTDPVYFHSIYV